MEWTHETMSYKISDRKELLQPDVILSMLQGSYWAATRTMEAMEKSIENSLCIGIYHNGVQVGFARAITDRATFSWLCDVIIHPDHRGVGLGKWLMKFLCAHLDLKSTWVGLEPRDALGVFDKFKFERQEVMMLRLPAF